ncbi:hypothetical protein A9G11_05830 [Gilliamella sp. wkB108]|uniref:siderophore-interacting protein n=1 Tax=Gilliamella sp. wkB108 TaxID=3120256 RepID=UPI00080EBE85|nr:siderophore-interacting protein [Gilliamella apicola]OCG23478.1 hypothetical protein A9G11_05830 [Gilliamella apicola]
MPESPKRAIVNALLTVLKVERISQSFIRIYFHSDKHLTVNPLWICPHLKLLFTDPVTGTITFPQLDENNKIVVNETIRRLARSYSIRGYDETTNQLLIDFAVHPKGLATLWAQHAKPGDQVGIVGTVGKVTFSGKPVILMGDISAVPSICYTLEHLPKNQKVYAFIEVNYPSDIMPLVKQDDSQVNWLIRDQNKPNQLIDAVMAADLTSYDDLLFWGGMESSLAQQLRHTIKDKYTQLSPDAVQIISYWREGFAEGEFRRRE